MGKLGEDLVGEFFGVKLWVSSFDEFGETGDGFGVEKMIL